MPGGSVRRTVGVPTILDFAGSEPPLVVDGATGTVYAVTDADAVVASAVTISQTAAETAAGVTPTNYAYLPGDVRRYGAVGDGVTNDTAAVQAAINVAQEDSSTTVKIYGVYATNNLTVTSGFVKFLGSGYECSRIIKNANGPLITVTNSNFVEFHYIDFQGVGGTYTGKGIDFVSGCSYPKFVGCHFSLFADYSFDFDTSGGSRLHLIDCVIAELTGSTQTWRIGRSSNVDSGAMFRRITNCILGGIGRVYGALDLFVQGGTVTNIEMDSGCAVCLFMGVSYGAGGSSITLDGGSNSWVGCRWSAGPLTLASTLQNSQVEGVLTSGTLVDNSSRGSNSVCIRDGNVQAIYTGNASKKSTGETTVHGDAAISLSANSPRNNVWNSPLTADRNCNLPATNLYNGMEVYVARTTSSTGAFNLNVNGNGGLMKALGIGTWFRAVCDGTTWYASAYGAL